LKKSIILIDNFLSSASGTVSIGETLALKFSAAGWQILTVSAKTNRLSRLIDMLSTIWLQRRCYTLAHVSVYSGAAFLWAEAVRCGLQMLKKPYVLTLHGGNLPAFSRRWPSMVRALLQSAAAVTTPSGYLLKEMRAYRRDLYMIPNPLDLQSYPFRLRAQPQPRLVWLRAFHAIYDPQMAPQVVSILAPEFPDIQLVMVGPDKRDGSIQTVQQAIKALGATDQITIQGKVPKSEVPWCLNRGDIFLNTSTIDNLPVSVLEAMASGLCVVSTNVGGIPYLLKHEEDALLVHPNDAEAMAAAVRRILLEPGLASRLSQNARRKAEQFDWSIILPQWEELLTAVAEQGL
jgi:glycosyltransferase involved in cell wall biosynthesis